MLALNDQLAKMFSGPLYSHAQRAEFKRFCKECAVIPTILVCVLGFTVMTLVYVVNGVFSTTADGWFGGDQRIRLLQISICLLVMLAMAVVWRFKRSHWTAITYLVLILGFSISPVHTYISGDIGGAWRWLAPYFVFVAGMFGLLRLPLIAMLVVSVISGAVVLYNLSAWHQVDSLMIGLTGGMHILGIGLWMSNRWRDHQLFEERLVGDQMTGNETTNSMLSDQIQRKVIHSIRQPLTAVSLRMDLIELKSKGGDVMREDLIAMNEALVELQARVDDLAGDKNLNAVSSALQAQVVPGSLKGATILVVDNESLVRAATSTIFEIEGANVLSVPSAQDAIEQYQASESDVDLLVCDYRLGDGMTGLELIRRIRRIGNAKTPAMIVTGYPADIPDVTGEAITILTKPLGLRVLRTQATLLLNEVTGHR